jgi:hypothetical protein
VAHDAEQVGAGRGARQAEVALAEPVELPQQRVARLLEVVLERHLRVDQIGHPADHAASGPRTEPPDVREVRLRSTVEA